MDASELRERTINCVRGEKGRKMDERERTQGHQSIPTPHHEHHPLPGPSSCLSGVHPRSKEGGLAKVAERSRPRREAGGEVPLLRGRVEGASVALLR
jgi:hypothetical protein